MKAILPLVVLLAGTESAPRLQPGDAAKPFSLPASNGKTVQLSDYRGKKVVVLAFFPKAFTGGWTKEMSAFRDMYSQFADNGAQVLGVSMDILETQTKFAESLSSPFPLLADAEGTAARAYGVMSEGKDGTKYASRVTFVIGKDGKITSVFEGKDAMDPAGALGACH